MTGDPRNIWQAVHVWAVAIALVVSACDRVPERVLYGPERRLDKEIMLLERADRMVIHDASGKLPDVTIRDLTQIRDVAAFFGRYRDGWVIFSGAAGDYGLYLYKDNLMVGRLGLIASSRSRPGEDTLNFGDYFRRVPASDVSALARQLNLPWPPR